MIEIDDQARRGETRNVHQYVLILLILSNLLASRVLAQLMEFVYPVSFLPSYAAWHSGASPYGVLLLAQGVILAVCLRVVWSVFQGTVVASRQKGNILLALGLIYLVSMCIRLMIGLMIASDHFWFGATLPTFFHIVLASFLIVYGRFHVVISRELVDIEKVDMG